MRPRRRYRFDLETCEDPAGFRRVNTGQALLLDASGHGYIMEPRRKTGTRQPQAHPQLTLPQQFANYDPRLISVLEVIGSHFAEIYYNDVYNSAKTAVTSGTNLGSITEEFRSRVRAFIVGVKTDAECYHDTVDRVHKYFVAQTRYTTLQFAQFVNVVVEMFIPETYLDIIKTGEKDETLSSVICDLVAGLGTYTTTRDMLQRIIDDHDTYPQQTIRMIQDHAITVLLAKRDEIHNRFLRMIGQAKNTAPIDMVETLKKAIRKLTKEKAKLMSKVATLEEELEAAAEKTSGHKSRESKFKTIIRHLRYEKRHGVREAAFAYSTPRPDNIAEGDDDDPLDLTPPEPQPAERIAEKRGGLLDAVVDKRGGPPLGADKRPTPSFFRTTPFEIPPAPGGGAAHRTETQPARKKTTGGSDVAGDVSDDRCGEYDGDSDGDESSSDVGGDVRPFDE